jgi:glycyl-tRNA synthetase beta subunit
MAKNNLFDGEIIQIRNLKMKIAMAVSSYDEVEEYKGHSVILQYNQALPSEKVKKEVSKFFHGRLRICYEDYGYLSINRLRGDARGDNHN